MPTDPLRDVRRSCGRPEQFWKGLYYPSSRNAWLGVGGWRGPARKGYWNVWKTLRTDVFQEGQKTQREAAARPDIVPRLSLVVLPFVNLNNDPEQDYFADSITTDLTTDLAQVPGAFVIGRGTAFTYKNKQIDFKTLGKDLGIRWAVQGAVRRNGDQVRVNVSLTDLPTGRDIWSDRFEGDHTNPAALQDRITARLARRSILNSSKPKAAVAKRTDPGIQTPWISLCAAGQSSMSLGRRRKLHRQRTYSTVRCASTRTTSMQ